MTPQPGKKSLVSEVIFIFVLLVLLVILGACAVFIYNYMAVHTPTPTPTPKPTATATATPTPRPTLTPTPVTAATPTAKPTDIDPAFYQKDTKVTMGEFDYYYPGIWSHYIVYDMFDGTKNYTFLYDINTGDRNQIADGIVFSYGTISNNKILMFYPTNGNRIYLYDITTHDKALTCTDDSSTRGSITMFDNKLAYYQDVGHTDSQGKWVAEYHIYVFDLIEGIAADVIGPIAKPLDIRIYGNRLVYTVTSSTGSDIYLLDLSAKTPTPRKISTGSGNNNHARIYDNHIVYHSDADSGDHVYIYDINTGNTICPAPGSSQWNGDIYGDTVVYDDNRNGNWDIYTYDIGAQTERRLTNEPDNQRAPVVYGKYVAYMDDRLGYNAIYYISLT
jgi:beta propeller repeat protein